VLLCQNSGTICNAIDDYRKELWETMIELQGHSAFNRICVALIYQLSVIILRVCW